MIRSQQLQMLHEQERQMQEAQNLSIIETDSKIWCPICRRPHDPREMGSILLEHANNFEEANEECDMAPPGDDVSQQAFGRKPIKDLGYLSR